MQGNTWAKCRYVGEEKCPHRSEKKMVEFVRSRGMGPAQLCDQDNLKIVDPLGPETLEKGKEIDRLFCIDNCEVFKEW